MGFARESCDHPWMSMTQRRWFGLSAGVLFGVAFAVHCGSEEGSVFDECRTIYGDRCGAACSDNGQCSAGLFCSGGRCNAECGPTRSCGSGVACSANGRCENTGFGGGSTNPDGGGQGGQGGQDGCADLNVELGKKTPTVLVLVDRSGSMTQAFGTGTRWTVLKKVLLDDGGTIQSLQSEVNFGLSMYSNPTKNACPELVGVSYGLNNYAAIDGVLRPAGTNPDTPTGESILGVAGITDAGLVDGGLAALDAKGGEKLILLVTDGDPDTCENPNANDAPLNPVEVQKAKDVAVSAVQRAFAAGIKTYVLAIGNEVSEAHQQEMANAGLGLNPDAGAVAAFFRPADEAQLIAQINAVITGARPCKYTLNGTVQPGFESQGTVLLNGAVLPFGDPNGWRLSTPSEIELVGAACQTVKTSANASLSASFPCGAVIVR